MGDDSPHMNLPKYRKTIYFFSAFSLFLKPSCLLMHIMMVPPGTKPEFPFICKNRQWETLGLVQTTACTPHSEGNSSLPYFSCSVHARCLTEKGGWLFLGMEPELSARKGCLWHIHNRLPPHGSMEQGEARGEHGAGESHGEIFWLTWPRLCRTSNLCRGSCADPGKGNGCVTTGSFRERERGKTKVWIWQQRGWGNWEKHGFVQNQLLGTLFRGDCSVLAHWSALPPWSPALKCPPRACQMFILLKTQA